MRRRQLKERLTGVHTDLTHILNEFERWHAHVEDLAPDGFGNGTDGIAVTGGSTSDPTLTAALARSRYTRKIDEATRVILHLENEARRLRNIIESIPKGINLEQIKRATRCSGAVDPLCRNHADGRRHKTGLCDRCWMTRYRQGPVAS